MRRSLPPLRRPKVTTLEWAVPVLLYVVLVLSSFSTSSLGIWVMREWVAHPLGVTIGSEAPGRTDEWRTQLMVETSVMAHGHSQPSWLSYDPDVVFQMSSGQPVESLFFFESSILGTAAWLPAWLDGIPFSAARNLPWLVLLLALPRLLRRFGANRPMSWLATFLFAFAPVSAWSSYSTVRLGSWISLGCLLLLLAADRFRGRVASDEGEEYGWVARTGWRARLHLARERLSARVPEWVKGVVLAGLGGLLLGRMATNYVPWQITIGLPLVTATALVLLAGRDRIKSGVLTLGSGALIGAAGLGAVFWENRDGLTAQLNTAYPGERRVTGMPSEPWAHAGAGSFFNAKGQAISFLNPLELSTAYTLCALWALLLVALAWRRLDTTARAAVIGLGAWVALWQAWCSFNWGAFGAAIPVLNLIPPHRVAQTVGLPAALLVGVLLSHLPRSARVRWIAGAVAGLSCAAFTWWGGRDLAQRAMPELGAGQILGYAAVVALVVLVVTRWPHRGFVALAAILVVLAPVITVNPAQFGMGDLLLSRSAKKAREIATKAVERGVLVATDESELDVLFTANGAPMLTGTQGTGPRPKRWELLDPGGANEVVWNRGVSYIWWTVNDPTAPDNPNDNFNPAPVAVDAAPILTNPTPDSIQIHASVCRLRADGIPVGFVVSRKENLPCTQRLFKMRWGRGAFPVYIYQVVPPAEPAKSGS